MNKIKRDLNNLDEDQINEISDYIEDLKKNTKRLFNNKLLNSFDEKHNTKITSYMVDYERADYWVSEYRMIKLDDYKIIYSRDGDCENGGVYRLEKFLKGPWEENFDENKFIEEYERACEKESYDNDSFQPPYTIQFLNDVQKLLHQLK